MFGDEAQHQAPMAADAAEASLDEILRGNATVDDADEFPTENLFTAEIEGVDTSDWAVDADQIWGDGVVDVIDEGGDLGLDFMS